MKRGILSSYVFGIKDTYGESFSNLLKYFFPELVTAFVLYSALSILDGYLIGHLKSTSAYATLGITNGVMHFLLKVAEGISVGSIILCGQYNGATNYTKVGRTLADTFWVTIIIGAIISSTLYFGAASIYNMLDVPPKMAMLGIPFIRLRAIGIFFTFVYFAFIAFLRGIKNTRAPMFFFLVGAVFFVFFDYALIFGEFGFPQMKLNGSALACVIQYSIMLLLAMIFVITNKEYKKYSIDLFTRLLDFQNIKLLLVLSLPVVLDKATMAASYIWLGKMIAPMGKNVIASFAVIKDLERFSFLPGLAFAQIITFLASNDFGAQNYTGIKSNIKKVIFLASIFVFLFMGIILINPRFVIGLFDKKAAFTDFSASVFPALSIFVFLDLLQLILSGALRGVGAVKTVMWTRIIVCFGLFCPLSYLISQMPIADQLVKFLLIYGTFYLGSGIMSIVYINKFRSYSWKKEPDNIANVAQPAMEAAKS